MAEKSLILQHYVMVFVAWRVSFSSRKGMQILSGKSESVQYDGTRKRPQNGIKGHSEAFFYRLLVCLQIAVFCEFCGQLFQLCVPFFAKAFDEWLAQEFV